MLEVTGSNSFYTETREKPRKKYNNWRYKSPSASRVKNRTTTSENDTGFSKPNVLFDYSFLSKSVDLDLISATNIPKEESRSICTRSQKYESCDDEDCCICTNSWSFPSFLETKNDHFDKPVVTFCSSNRPKSGERELKIQGNLEEKQRKKLETIEFEVEEMTLKLKLLQQEEEKLKLENSLRLSRIAKTDSSKWYEKRNTDFCIGANRNNKMLKINRNHNANVNYKRDLLKLAKNKDYDSDSDW